MLPALPTELWLDILSLAVHEPGIFETKWKHSPDEQIWEGGVTRRMTTKSLQVRRAITLVSRDWWMLAIRFLYEDVRVSMLNSDNTMDFAVFLEQNPAAAAVATPDRSEVRIVNGVVSVRPVNRVNRGWWVKKITATIRGEVKEDGVSGLLRLLGACSNLRILYFDPYGFDASFLPRLSQVLQSRFAHSLRNVAIHTRQSDAMIERPSSLIHLLAMPLDSFAFTVDSTALSLWNDHFLPAVFTNLSALEIVIPDQLSEPKLPSLAIPTLRYLSIRGLYDERVNLLLPFMKSNGRHLLGLGLWGRRRCHNLHLILEHTIALKSFVIDDMDLDVFRPPGNPSYPSITHIGVRGVKYANSTDASRIAQGLAHILSRQLFSSLHTVRILTRDFPGKLDQGWGQSIAVATKYGVRLEDFERRLLETWNIPSGNSIGRCKARSEIFGRASTTVGASAFQTWAGS